MQHINFYFKEYRPKPLSFDSRFAAAALGLVMVGLVIIGSVQQMEVGQLKTTLQTKQDNVKALKAEVERLNIRLRENTEISSLEAAFARNQNILSEYRHALDKVNMPGVAEQVAFSQVFSDLATRKAGTLWLTQIEIDALQLSLHGATTDSTNIPKYVTALNQAESLNRQFDQLEISRDKNDGRIVNFSLLNGKKLVRPPAEAQPSISLESEDEG